MFTSAGIAVPVLYGAFGFFLAFFLRRAISVVIIGLLLCALFKLLAIMNVGVDWLKVSRLGSLITEMGSTFMLIGKSFINSANSTSLILFIVGSLVGLFLAMSRR